MKQANILDQWQYLQLQLTDPYCPCALTARPLNLENTVFTTVSHIEPL